uniref:F-box domain-containing protein n=1 Tax=Arundo donax TaxID=35708 RepID=A0A0A9G605_ARUDO
MESDDEESGVDRISMLPTEILHNILSSMRIRIVVRMRRLSRKWKEVCESLQFICLKYSEFEHWKYERFARFVNNLLLIRSKVDLHTFELVFDSCHPQNYNDVRMWIGYAVKHNVEVLDLILDGYDKTVLPLCIFTCHSLQELNLSMGEAPDLGALLLPDIINLPSQKVDSQLCGCG